MLEDLPQYISWLFGLTTIITVVLFLWILKGAKPGKIQKNYYGLICMLVFWLIFQMTLALLNTYNSDIDSVPPKILLFGIVPPILFITFLFVTQRGKKFADSLSLVRLTFLNIVRIPVEIILFLLFINDTVPELMTFEGRNYDILAGVSAPVVSYLLFKGKIKDRLALCGILFVLVFCLILLFNAFFSAPSPVQKFGFEQPNIAILNFTFIWLPTFIVPLVLFFHIVSIRLLLKNPES